MVLSELQLPDGNWKDVLGQLAPMIQRPRLIVFSRNADNRLWEEVLNLGAFDLLITPFREHELVFAIGSAGLTGRVNKRTPVTEVCAWLTGPTVFRSLRKCRISSCRLKQQSTHFVQQR